MHACCFWVALLARQSLAWRSLREKDFKLSPLSCIEHEMSFNRMYVVPLGGTSSSVIMHDSKNMFACSVAMSITSKFGSLPKGLNSNGC